MATYKIENKEQQRNLSWLRQLLLMTIFALVTVACQNEDEFIIPKADTPQLTASQENLTLSQKQANNPAIDLSWTRGTNRGTDAAIDYVLQIAENDLFDNFYEMDLGRVVYNHQFDNKSLNNLVKGHFGFNAGEAYDLLFRIKTVIADTAVADEFSNAVAVNVTPYEPVSETLYMIGDAAPNGWDAGNATELIPDNESPGMFTYSGSLSTGELKFITTKGQFLPSYNKGEDENSLVYRTEDNQPDEKFSIAQGGVYQIQADLLDLTISIEKLDQPPFSQLYIVGDASESGWNIDSPVAFEQSDSDPFIFTYEGLLTPGSFKVLAGSTGDWCGEWYRPLVNDQEITSTAVAQNSGCDVDNNWQVTEATSGFYKITLNTREVAISIEPVNLYIVGDAGPNGWNIGDPAPMERNGAVYTYSGPLTAGEFKISKFQGDWCDGDWINAAIASQPISNTEFITTQGCDGPDNKWAVDNNTAGDYIITIDLANETMTIE